MSDALEARLKDGAAQQGPPISRRGAMSRWTRRFSTVQPRARPPLDSFVVNNIDWERPLQLIVQNGHTRLRWLDNDEEVDANPEWLQQKWYLCPVNLRWRVCGQALQGVARSAYDLAMNYLQHWE